MARLGRSRPASNYKILPHGSLSSPGTLAGPTAQVAVLALAGTVQAGNNTAGPASNVSVTAYSGTYSFISAGPVSTVSVAASAGSIHAGATLSGPTPPNVVASAYPGIVVITSNISVVQQVTGSFTNDYGITTVAMNNTAGNCLVVFAGWDVHNNYTDAYVPVCYVADSVGNYWIHLGTSGAGGYGSRCSIWICPNARAVQWVSVSLTGFTSSVAYTIVEMSGMPDFAELDLSTSQFINGGTAAPTTIQLEGSSSIHGQWIVPNNVTEAEVEAWGGGGAGGGVYFHAISGGANVASGGGGGAGEYAAEPRVALVPGGAYSYTAGSAGAGYLSASGTSGGNSTITGALGVPETPLVSAATGGGTVAAGTYHVILTYVNAAGETTGSASASITTTGTTSQITINSPAPLSNATGWYAYVTQAGGSTYTRQQAAGSPTALETNFDILSPPTSTGAAPPSSNTATLTITAHGGAGGTRSSSGGTGGAGGSGSTNSIHANGGHGGNGRKAGTSGNAGGGGGGASGDSGGAGGAGQAGKVSVGGLGGAPNPNSDEGGEGGNGGSPGQWGNSGLITPAGGGGGGGVTFDGSVYTWGGGAAGNPGIIQLTYTPTTAPASLSISGNLTTNDIVFVMLAAGNGSETLSSGPSGFTALSTAAAGGTVDGMTIYPYYLGSSQGASSTSASFTVGAGTALSAVMVGISLSPPIPTLTNPNMPLLKVEAAFGSQPGDPSQPPPTWTDITDRVITSGGGSFVHALYGATYELTQQESGEISISVDNHDGAFTPGNGGSPYAPYVLTSTPIRVSAYWNGSWYFVAYGYAERWPQDWPDLPQWGISRIVATDAISVLSSTNLPSAVQGDILVDQPYAYFPCDEQYATTIQGLNFFKNASDAGGLLCVNASRISQRSGIYVDGINTTSVATGQALNLLGDNGTVIGPSSFPSTIPANVPISGPGMVYYDQTMPGTNNANGWSCEFWFVYTAFSTTQTIFQAFMPPTVYSPVVALFVWINTSNQLNINVADGTSYVGPAVSTSGVAQHLTITLSGSSAPTMDIYLNGNLTNSFALSASQVAPLYGVSLGPCFYAYASIPYCGDFVAGHLAIYPYQLPASRVLAHYNSGVSGWSNHTAPFRAAQILTWGFLGLPRAGTHFSNQSDGILMGPAYDLLNTSASNALDNVTASDSGALLSMPSGAVTYIDRWHTFNLTASFTMGDSAPEPLNYNADLGDGLTAWSGSQCTLTISTAETFTLFDSILLTPNSGATDPYLYGDYSYAPLIDPGESYYASAWVYVPTGWNAVEIGFDWLDSSRNKVTSSTTQVSVPVGAWVFIQTVQTAPLTGATYGTPRLGMANSPSSTVIMYAQNVWMTVGNEVPFELGQGFDYDTTYLYNVAEYSQVIGPNSGITAIVQDFNSQHSYFTRSALTGQITTSNNLDVIDKANWAENKYAQPGLRVRNIKVSAATKPSTAFRAVLTIRVGDVVSVIRRPIGGSVITGTYLVTKITHDIGPGKWDTEYEMSPYTLESNVLVSDNGSYNTLGDVNLS